MINTLYRNKIDSSSEKSNFLLMEHFVTFLLLQCFCVSFTEQAAPIFVNLPTDNNIGVAENSGTGTSLFKVVGYDADGDAITYAETSGDTFNLFSIDATSGVVTVTGAIDYETIFPSITFTLTLSATANGDTVTQSLIIDVYDINEGFTFDSAGGYSISAADRQAWGTYLPDPGISVTHIDAGDSITCTMACPTPSHFHMVKTTCQVYFTVVYSLDAGDASPVECVVTARDSKGMTGTSTLTITITDTNGYTPKFSQSSYYFYASHYDPVGTTIAAPGAIAATDTDIDGTHGTITYSITQLPAPYDYFQIDPATARITTTRELPVTAAPLSFTVTALDGGGLSSTVPVTVNVATTTTTTTVSTTRHLELFDDPGTMPWLVICIFTALAALVAALYIICNYCCKSQGRYYNASQDYDYQHDKNSPDTPIESVRKPPPRMHSWQMTRNYP